MFLSAMVAIVAKVFYENSEEAFEISKKREFVVVDRLEDVDEIQVGGYFLHKISIAFAKGEGTR